jgi:hypothetical protein
MPPKTRKRSITPSRATPFQTKNLLEFGLEITHSEPKGLLRIVVTCVGCLFCKRFWRVNAADDNESRKRKRTANTKFFTAPFRKEKFAQHVRSQLAAQFEEYSALTFEEKKSFFDTKKRVQDSIHRYMNASRTALMIPLAKDIVEVLIGEIFFKPELDENDAMMEPITKITALKFFHQQPDESYVAKVSNSALFDLVLKHTSVGLSFRKTSAVIEHHKESFGNGKLAGLNDHEVGKMVRFNVAANLQVLSDVLNDDEVWAFSLAGDTTIHQGVSFFDVRIRVCVRGVLHNVHLVCLPFYDRHTAKNMCLMVCKLLDNLCVSWRSKLVSVSTDGENMMTGWIGGFVTLMAKEAVYEVLRVWCPPHQMDLVIQDATVQISDGLFAKTTHSVMVHLRQQGNLQLEMASKCPEDTNRWAHFQGQLLWLLTHRVRLILWVVDRQPASSPSVAYWIIAAAINPLAKACNVTIVNLQKHDIVLSHQTAEIEKLIQKLLMQVDIQHKDDNADMQREDREDGKFVENGPWWATLDAVFVHVKDQVTWVKDMFLSLEDVEQIYVLRQIGGYALRLVNGLFVVQAERDYRNNAAAELAPADFPQQLAKMRTSTFIEKVLNPRRDVMIAAWAESQVDKIEQQHRVLLEMIRSSAPLKATVDRHTCQTMFNEAWNAFTAQDSLSHLRAFCGGLATVFANTASLETTFPS